MHPNFEGVQGEVLVSFELLTQGTGSAWCFAHHVFALLFHSWFSGIRKVSQWPRKKEPESVSRTRRACTPWTETVRIRINTPHYMSPLLLFYNWLSDGILLAKLAPTSLQKNGGFFFSSFWRWELFIFEPTSPLNRFCSLLVVAWAYGGTSHTVLELWSLVLQVVEVAMQMEARTDDFNFQNILNQTTVRFKWRMLIASSITH